MARQARPPDRRAPATGQRTPAERSRPGTRAIDPQRSFAVRRSRLRPPVKPPLVSTQELRSQIALELLLNGYAIVGTLFVFRALFKALQVSQQRWVGSLVYGTTGIIADRLLRIPSANATLIGDMTLVDLTLLAGVILFPLGLLMFGNRQDR